MTAPKRSILRTETAWDERMRLSPGTFSWSSTPVHTLFLECGHKQVRRGFSEPPSSWVRCKKCSAGAPKEFDPTTVEPGRVAPGRPTGADLIEALLASPEEGASR